METKVKMIGLSGRARSGKNLAAKYITEILHKQDPSRLIGEVGFADGVKYVAAEALSINRMTFFEDENKEKRFHLGGSTELTGRDVLQRIGTEMFRNMLSQDFWVYRLMKVIKAQSAFFFIITDVRFPNEVKAIEDAGGVIIKLYRETGLDDSHLSETALDGYEFKYNIYNDGSKGWLKENLEAIIKDLNT